MTNEEIRLQQSDERKKHWKRWGPYLNERSWGTVREDYSATGEAWDYFPHDHARSRAYRWNEDGIAGICDRHQNLCFALTLWNEKDPILKERLFGLTGSEGNHGEDVKEYYYYFDNMPTHFYMKYLYKYPHAAFPYEQLLREPVTGRSPSQKHFVYIAQAINGVDEAAIGLWHAEDGLFYDVLHCSDGERVPMKVRSMVGLIPLYVVQAMKPEFIKRMPAFKRRLDWFIANRPELTKNMACMRSEGMHERRLFSITSREHLEGILAVMLDEREFLSSNGIRAL